MNILLVGGLIWLALLILTTLFFMGANRRVNAQIEEQCPSWCDYPGVHHHVNPPFTKGW